MGTTAVLKLSSPPMTCEGYPNADMRALSCNAEADIPIERCVRLIGVDQMPVITTEICKRHVSYSVDMMNMEIRAFVNANERAQ